MNTEILKRLTDAQLFELKAAVEKEVHNRIDYSILPGRTGWFINPKNNQRIDIVVERINQKTISCADVTNVRTKWKVSPEFLRMDGVSRAPEKRYSASPKPSESYNQTAW